MYLLKDKTPLSTTSDGVISEPKEDKSSTDKPSSNQQEPCPLIGNVCSDSKSPEAESHKMEMSEIVDISSSAITKSETSGTQYVNKLSPAEPETLSVMDDNTLLACHFLAEVPEIEEEIVSHDTELGEDQFIVVEGTDGQFFRPPKKMSLADYKRRRSTVEDVPVTVVLESVVEDSKEQDSDDNDDLSSESEESEIVKAAERAISEAEISSKPPPVPILSPIPAHCEKKGLTPVGGSAAHAVDVTEMKRTSEEMIIKKKSVPLSAGLSSSSNTETRTEQSPLTEHEIVSAKTTTTVASTSLQKPTSDTGKGHSHDGSAVVSESKKAVNTGNTIPIQPSLSAKVLRVLGTAISALKDEDKATSRAGEVSSNRIESNAKQTPLDNEQHNREDEIMSQNRSGELNDPIRQTKPDDKDRNNEKTAQNVVSEQQKGKDMVPLGTQKNKEDIGKHSSKVQQNSSGALSKSGRAVASKSEPCDVKKSMPSPLERQKSGGNEVLPAQNPASLVQNSSPLVQNPLPPVMTPENDCKEAQGVMESAKFISSLVHRYNIPLHRPPPPHPVIPPPGSHHPMIPQHPWFPPHAPSQPSFYRPPVPPLPLPQGSWPGFGGVYPRHLPVPQQHYNFFNQYPGIIPEPIPPGPPVSCPSSHSPKRSRSRSRSPSSSPSHSRSSSPSSQSNHSRVGDNHIQHKLLVQRIVNASRMLKDLQNINDPTDMSTLPCDACVQTSLETENRMVQVGSGFKRRNHMTQTRQKITHNFGIQVNTSPKMYSKRIQTDIRRTKETHVQTQHKPTVDNSCQTVPEEECIDAIEDFDNLRSTIKDDKWSSVLNILDGFLQQIGLGPHGEYTEAMTQDEQSSNSSSSSDGDSVFDSHRQDDTLLSPVISGASNISEGDLSDLSPMESKKTSESGSPTQTLPLKKDSGDEMTFSTIQFTMEGSDGTVDTQLSSSEPGTVLAAYHDTSQCSSLQSPFLSVNGIQDVITHSQIPISSCSPSSTSHDTPRSNRSSPAFGFRGKMVKIPGLGDELQEKKVVIPGLGDDAEEESLPSHSGNVTTSSAVHSSKSFLAGTFSTHTLLPPNSTCPPTVPLHPPSFTLSPSPQMQSKETGKAFSPLPQPNHLSKCVHPNSNLGTNHTGSLSASIAKKSTGAAPMSLCVPDLPHAAVSLPSAQGSLGTPPQPVSPASGEKSVNSDCHGENAHIPSSSTQDSPAISNKNHLAPNKASFDSTDPKSSSKTSAGFFSDSASSSHNQQPSKTTLKPDPEDKDSKKTGNTESKKPEKPALKSSTKTTKDKDNLQTSSSISVPSTAKSTPQNNTKEESSSEKDGGSSLAQKQTSWGSKSSKVSRQRCYRKRSANGSHSRERSSSRSRKKRKTAKNENTRSRSHSRDKNKNKHAPSRSTSQSQNESHTDGSQSRSRSRRSSRPRTISGENRSQSPNNSQTDSSLSGSRNISGSRSQKRSRSRSRKRSRSRSRKRSHSRSRKRSRSKSKERRKSNSVRKQTDSNGKSLDRDKGQTKKPKTCSKTSSSKDGSGKNSISLNSSSTSIFKQSTIKKKPSLTAAELLAKKRAKKTEEEKLKQQKMSPQSVVDSSLASMEIKSSDGSRLCSLEATPSQSENIGGTDAKSPSIGTLVLDATDDPRETKEDSSDSKSSSPIDMHQLMVNFHEHMKKVEEKKIKNIGSKPPRIALHDPYYSIYAFQIREGEPFGRHCKNISVSPPPVLSPTPLGSPTTPLGSPPVESPPFGSPSSIWSSQTDPPLRSSPKYPIPQDPPLPKESPMPEVPPLPLTPPPPLPVMPTPLAVSSPSLSPSHKEDVLSIPDVSSCNDFSVVGVSSSDPSPKKSLDGGKCLQDVIVSRNRTRC